MSSSEETELEELDRGKRRTNGSDQSTEGSSDENPSDDDIRTPPKPRSKTKEIIYKIGHPKPLDYVERILTTKIHPFVPIIIWQMIAEAIGTMFIVIFGVGSVNAAVLTGAQVGLWQVAVVWGWGIALAIYATGYISGAHLNPAVSLSFAIFRSKDFPIYKLIPYWFAQFTGGIIGACVNLGIWYNFITRFEGLNNITRGEDASVASGMVFGEYFPNPALFPDPDDEDVVSVFGAFCVEAWATGVLVFLIFALIDKDNKAMKAKELVPVMIGMTVAVLISLYAPITQGGYNPARDFSPRVVAALAGWDEAAIPGPRNGFWLYILGPLFGGVIGALVHDVFLRPGYLRMSYLQGKGGKKWYVGTLPEPSD